jgi:phage-related baseplate assembly protein
MSVSFDDLISVETRESVTGTLLGIASALGLSTTAWQEGQPIRTFLSTVAQKCADYTAVKREIVMGTFLRLATGDWLTFTASNRYGVDRNLARAATGTITLTNADPGTYTIQPGELVVAHSVTGKTYRNTASISLPPGTLAGVPVQSEELGTANDAAPGLITHLVTTLVGVTVTNPGSVLGGDEEDDEQLRDRCLSQQESTSPMGPKGVYDYVARTPLYSATSSPITRTSGDLDTTSGTMTLYLATATGAPIGADVDIVQAAIDEWAEPQGFLATAEAATPLGVTVDLTVAIVSSLTVAEIRTAVQSAVAQFFATIDIGGTKVPPSMTGYVYTDALKGAVIASTPGVKHVTLTSPAADVTVGAHEVPTLTSVTVAVVFL